MGGETVNFTGNAKLFQPLLYITENWKSAGWSAIIYMAAISGIDMDQYEAADLDGASRLQKIFRITLPNILPTISVMFVLQMGSLMSGGFDQIFNLSNPAVKDVSRDFGYVYLRHYLWLDPRLQFFHSGQLFSARW